MGWVLQITISFALFYGGDSSVVSANGIADPKDGSLYDRDLRLHWGQDQACGIAATYLILKRMGASPSLQTLYEEIPISMHGSDMHSLISAIEIRGLEATAIEISDTGLLNALSDSPDAAAIAWLDGSHWAAMFSQDDGIALFEYPGLSEVEPEEFSERFGNRAIFVTSTPSRQLEKNSKIRLASLLLGIANCFFVACVLYRRSRDAS